MKFESDGMKFTQPLDLYQGPWYTDLADENMEHYFLDQLYTTIVGN